MKTHCLKVTVAGLALAGAGCVSQLTVSSGGASSPGYCNKQECAWGSLYGIDWCGKKNGVQSQAPMYPMSRASTVVRPCDFVVGFFTLGLIIPLHLEYNLETSPLPKRSVK